MNKLIALAEPIFKSIQGEGDRTGRLSIWIRFAGCSLQCRGFNQQTPTDPSTFIQPNIVNPKEYKTLSDLPVIEVGCDSLYAIDGRFKHLWLKYTIDEVVEKIKSLLPKDAQGIPQWFHPITLNEIDLCFTGGEPMLYQQEIQDILDKIFEEFGGCPNIQIETNGTIPLTESFGVYSKAFLNLYFNISPKLFNVSGEASSKAWKPEVIISYIDAGKSYLKFVVNNSDAAWDELNDKVVGLHINKYGFCVPTGVMFVGATKEQQSDPVELKKFADRAVAEGYHISGRLHCQLWGNGIGT